jgi:hypothetical protein
LRNFSRLDEAEKKSIDIHEGLDSTLLILGRHRFKATARQPGIEIIKTIRQYPVNCFSFGHN